MEKPDKYITFSLFFFLDRAVRRSVEIQRKPSYLVCWDDQRLRMSWDSCAPHHVNITQAVDPEGVQGRRDAVELISFKGLLTLPNRAV